MLEFVDIVSLLRDNLAIILLSGFLPASYFAIQASGGRLNALLVLGICQITGMLSLIFAILLCLSWVLLSLF